MTGFINSNGVEYVLTYCNSLDCFVPRNDGARVSSLRACEAIQKKQNTKALQKLAIGYEAIRYFGFSMDYFVPRNDGSRVSSLRACEAIQKKQNTKALQKHAIGYEAIRYFRFSLDCFVVIISLCICLSGCKNTGNATTGQAVPDDTVQTVTPKFTTPNVPTVITDPNLQIEYFVRHYWDHFDFADTAYVPTPEITEQAWVDYVDLLYRLPQDKAQEELKSMMLKSAHNNKKLFEYFAGLADKYLYDPNSPARNEELYIPVLEAMIQAPVLDDTEKILPQMRLDWAFKNRIGTQAINFQYTGITGQTGSLYQLRTTYILLFFNNPECTSCIEHIEGIRKSAIINSLIAERRLTILSIYPDREVEGEWKKNYAIYPTEWIKGYDPSFTIGEKYDLKASPTLYLLDIDKMVLLKDASLPFIENYLAFVLQ